jgi:threonyl-tRNA synthetase
MIIFKNKPRSYKELPMRVCELGTVHRQELSGVLAGLFRVIKFTQDDAHLYCTEETLEKEIAGVIPPELRLTIELLLVGVAP